MHKLWKRLPFLFKLQTSLLVAAMFATTVVVNLAAPQGYERVAFAIPAAEHVNRPWRAEVEDFGDKVSRAFGVRPSTAHHTHPFQPARLRRPISCSRATPVGQSHSLPRSLRPELAHAPRDLADSSTSSAETKVQRPRHCSGNPGAATRSHSHRLC